MFHSRSPSAYPQSLPYPRHGLFLEVQDPQQQHILIEYQGRIYVAICTAFKQLQPRDPVAIVATQDIFMIVQPKARLDI